MLKIDMKRWHAHRKVIILFHTQIELIDSEREVTIQPKIDAHVWEIETSQRMRLFAQLRSYAFLLTQSICLKISSFHRFSLYFICCRVLSSLFCCSLIRSLWPLWTFVCIYSFVFFSWVCIGTVLISQYFLRLNWAESVQRLSKPHRNSNRKRRRAKKKENERKERTKQTENSISF